MKFKRQSFFMFTVILLFFSVSCKSVSLQTEWKTNATELEKDVRVSKKNGFIVFTVSDSDDRSKYLLDSVFTKKFFEIASKRFSLYNVDIVRDESLMSSKDLERNYTLLRDYGVLEFPKLALTNEDGDVYHLKLIPEEIKSEEKFLEYLNGLYEKEGKDILTLKNKIYNAEGIEKTKAIYKFLQNIYLTDRKKYLSLIEAGIKNDPDNKTGFVGKLLFLEKQIIVDELLLEKKHMAAVKEFKELIESKMLSPEEEQLTWCNIAYFYSATPNASKSQIIKYLQKALNVAPNSRRAKDIKDDILYLKNQN